MASTWLPYHVVYPEITYARHWGTVKNLSWQATNTTYRPKVAPHQKQLY